LAAVQTAEREKYDVWDEILEEKLTGKGVNSTTLAAALQVIGVAPDRMDEKAKDRVSGCLRRLGFKSTPRKERGEDGVRRAIRIYVRDT
jgi:hypothetical protein